MTTAPTPTSPLIDNTWLNQDSAQRLITIEKLAIKEPGVEAFLFKVAQEDEHEAVRCAAIARIVDLTTLDQLKGIGGKPEESVQLQICRLVAGTLESNQSEGERIEKLKALSASGVKQVALLSKLKTIGTLAVEAISQNEDLVDLCLFASSVHVRKSAAVKIDDTHLLKEILGKVAGKDKTVSKIITERLEEKSIVASPTSSSDTKKAEAVSEKTAKSKPNKTEQAEKSAAPALDPKEEFATAETEAAKLSFKNTERLFALRSQLRKLHSRLADSDTQLRTQIDDVQKAISEKIAKNTEFQEQLKTKTEALLSTLAEALESGNSEIATQSWDKIQGNISNTANQVRAELVKQSNVYKEKIIELRDWKIFAATEKKKELIVQMQHLVESKMHASDRSKSISNMHKEWKNLGRSSQNEQLWKEFKQHSDLAYEPCKEYFKGRKQLMADNLQKRRELCDTLEAECKLLQEADNEPDLVALNKLLSESDNSWKQYAPIEQSKIKSLQKRYYATVNQLRKLRKSKLSVSAKQKQELVSQAQELAKNEDNKLAMNEAKRLQQEWKGIGPTSYREDQKYWQDFRAACDVIFNKRNNVAGEQNEELKKIETRLNEILATLDAIATKDDSEFRESRASYQDLAQEFSNSLDPRIKSKRKRLLERFNSTKRQIDARFRALPDKRQQQLIENVVHQSSLLASLEKALLVVDAPSDYAKAIEAFDLDAWRQGDNTGNSEADDLLKQRQRTVFSSKSTAELAQHCQQCEEKFRQLCVEAEIRANADSPAEDKALRMKIQLEQLQSGFGQAKPDPKQNLKYAMDAELYAIALGPLADTTREVFTTRLHGVLQKLR